MAAKFRCDYGWASCLPTNRSTEPSAFRLGLSAFSAPDHCRPLCVSHRAEPILTRMKEDHSRIILPAIDNIKYNTFEVQQYANAAHGYNWGLWCMYIIPPQDWLDKGDETAPIR